MCSVVFMCVCVTAANDTHRVEPAAKILTFLLLLIPNPCLLVRVAALSSTRGVSTRRGSSFPTLHVLSRTYRGMCPCPL
jgi:hypothetical protein